MRLLEEQDNRYGGRTSISLVRSSGFVAASIGLAVVYVLYSLEVNYISDDGFIVLRYVRNFLNGEGVVYNPGERVEGYTCFLWLMAIAGFRSLLPHFDLPQIAQLMGLVFGVFTILLVCCFARFVYGGCRLRGMLAGAFLAVHSGLVAWGTGGLETVMFAYIAFAGAFAYVVYLQTGRCWHLAPLVFAGAALTRPEGVLLFGITSVHFLVYERFRTGHWLTRRIAAWAAVFLAVYGPYYVWRSSYYGYPMPNTAYAKVGTGLSQHVRGMKYVYDYLKMYGIFVFAPCVLLLFGWRRIIWRDYLVLLVCVYVLYIVYVGGDGLAFFRSFAQIAPPMYVLVQEGLGELYDRAQRRVRGWKLAVPSALIVVVCLGATTRQTAFPILFPEHSRWYEPHCKLYFPGIGSDHTYRWFDNYFVDRLTAAASWLNANAPSGTLVASTPAGAIGFHVEHKVIDMLGLTDEHIAHTSMWRKGHGRAGHQKGDGPYVLSRAPDFVLMGNVAVFPWPVSQAEMPGLLRLKSEHELWDDPAFHDRYKLVCVRIAEEGLFQFFTFFQKRAASEMSVPEQRRGDPIELLGPTDAHNDAIDPAELRYLHAGLTDNLGAKTSQ